MIQYNTIQYNHVYFFYIEKKSTELLIINKVKRYKSGRDLEENHRTRKNQGDKTTNNYNIIIESNMKEQKSQVRFSDISGFSFHVQCKIQI